MAEIRGPWGAIHFQRDRWGYPTIWAKDRAEGAYARGFLHAEDRRVQVILNDHVAQGRLMELLGDRPFPRMIDRCIRAFDFAGRIDEEIASLPSQTRDLIQAYCDGFNASLQNQSTPLVLRLLGIPRPEWSIRSVFRLYRLMSYMGLSSLQHLAEASITALIAAKQATPELLQALLGDGAKGIDLTSFKDLSLESMDHFFPPPLVRGSNAIAIGKARSSSQGALLLSEFHMEIGKFPPLLYASHTQYTDGDYYQGMGVAGLPILSGGRTSKIGFTYTFAHGDGIDILVERCKEGRYLAEGTWHDLRRREETIVIKGKKKPERWLYFENDYGTIMGDAERGGDLPCVRWSGLRGGVASDLGILFGLFDCRSASEAAELHRQGKLISVWGVFADISGSIAYIHTGQIDDRPQGWTGAYPRLATDLPLSARQPRPLAQESRPLLLDPPRGFLISANERIDGPQGEVWSSFPEPSYRYQRLRQVLEALPSISLSDLAQLCYDEVDLCAYQMLSLWSALLPDEPLARDLCRWAAAQKSFPPASSKTYLRLFHALHFEITRLLLRRWLDPTTTEILLHRLCAVFCFQAHLDRLLLLQAPELLDKDGLRLLLAEAWPLAQATAKGKRFSVPLRMAFKHLLTQDHLPHWFGFNTGRLELPGSPTSLFQTRRIELRDEVMHAGPVFHLLIDMSQPGGFYNIAGGASEKRFGPGYGKGIEAWMSGHFEPLGPTPGQPPRLHRDQDNPPPPSAEPLPPGAFDTLERLTKAGQTANAPKGAAPAKDGRG